MQDFNTVGGRIIEIRRYVTPLWLYGQDARRERWELWIKTPNGADEKLIVESRSMQARRGHRVVLALEGGAPVGMVNLATRTRLNFARSDPPFLYRPLDIAVPLGLMFASLFENDNTLDVNVMCCATHYNARMTNVPFALSAAAPIASESTATADHPGPFVRTTLL